MEAIQSDGGARERVQTAISNAASALVDRQTLPELVALAAVAEEHLLVIGPPGTAKSEAVRRIARGFEANYFEYLLGRFTEPNELFGPVDLNLLRQGRVETDTTGMLPEAEIAFLDEVFLASNAILNTLLGVLNERRFVRGHTRKDCPLRVCVGASNGLPEDPSLAAFADRFLLRTFVEPVSDSSLETLLEVGAQRTASTPVATLADLDQLSRTAAAVRLDAVRPLLARCVRLLRSSGITLSDRRLVRTQRVIAAACALRGADSASGQDLWPLVFAVPTMDAQLQAREVLAEVLSLSVNATLVRASEDASSSAAARAERLLQEGKRLANADKTDPTDHRLRVEAWLRELDASLDASAISGNLADTRAALQRELQA